MPSGVRAGSGVSELRAQLRVFIFVVVDRFGKADPDVQQTESAAQSSEEPVGDQSAQSRIAQEQEIVGPLRRPRHDHQQHAGGRADEDKQQDQQSVCPYPGPRQWSNYGRRQVGIVLRIRSGSRGDPSASGKSALLRRVGFGCQAALRLTNDRTDTTTRRRSCSRKPIRTFYDFRALMRSPTSR
jgi:hypothetical protein